MVPLSGAPRSFARRAFWGNPGRPAQFCSRRAPREPGNRVPKERRSDPGNRAVSQVLRRVLPLGKPRRQFGPPTPDRAWRRRPGRTPLRVRAASRRPPTDRDASPGMCLHRGPASRAWGTLHDPRARVGSSAGRASASPLPQCHETRPCARRLTAGRARQFCMRAHGLRAPGVGAQERWAAVSHAAARGGDGVNQLRAERENGDVEQV